MKNSKKAGFIRFCQMIYLTVSFYFKNNLDASASACTFGFIFSFIPLLMMILTIFIGILHASPAMIEGLSNFISKYTNVVDVNKIVASIGTGISFSGINTFLSLWIIWMSRKLFLSIMQGLHRIFYTEAPSRPVLNQLLTFSGEILLIVIFAITFFSAFVARQIFALPAFYFIKFRFPFIYNTLSHTFIHIAFYAVLYIAIVLCYKFGSGTKPGISLCLISGLLCITSFYLTINVISHFINHSNYKTVYGVLSNLIILLFDVYIFFTLFMIFGQYVYTNQFLEASLLSELYLLPFNKKNLGFVDTMRHLLFISPAALMNKENTKIYEPNSIIYEKNDSAYCVFYIVSGKIQVSHNKKSIEYEAGSFFGEFEYLMDINRDGTATAIEESMIVTISNSQFKELLTKTPAAAAKAISKLPLQFRNKTLKD